jgi:hypothetical protein
VAKGFQLRAEFAGDDMEFNALKLTLGWFSQRISAPVHPAR